MNDLAFRASTSSTDAALDLRTLTRGRRSLGWLMGRSNELWLDRWTGRLAAGLARCCGLNVRGAWAGPFPTRRLAQTPALAWISLPIVQTTPRAFVDALNDALVERSTADGPDEQTDVERSMQRARKLHALDLEHKTLNVPAKITQHQNSEHVLLIDEPEFAVQSDMSRRERRAAFRAMVQTARVAHPAATFWLAPSAESGGFGRLSDYAQDLLPATVEYLSEDDSLCATLDHVAHSYTVAAPEGMHALLTGISLHVFGDPYYAGWGLTNDARPLPGRHARPTLAALFEVVFLRFARYLDPLTHGPGTLGALLDSIELQRAVAKRFNDMQRVAGVRFQWWKRPFATPFLTCATGKLRWTSDPTSIKQQEVVALWGARSAEGLPKGRRTVRIEDGFLHSTGLGSDMSAPRSQVLDTRGLYFDASQPSDLTVLLNDAEFDESELARAAALREQIVFHGLTKYNLGRRKPAWDFPAGKKVLLIPGQVADDASIRLGTRAITTADALLREVRALRPDAWIVYKPHPDVLSGNRIGLIDAERLADIVDIQSDLISLIDVADEVHTLSSLSGFEALLRGKTVHTYGMPFYAGWGLTHDALAPLCWRKRTLTLDMLTAGVMIRYPLYWDWKLQLFTTPERIVRELAPLAVRPLASVRDDRLRFPRKAFRCVRNALLHLIWRTQQTSWRETT